MIGAHGAGETPDTIPNSEAKPSSGDDTLYGESSTVPNYKKGVLADSFFLLLGYITYLHVYKKATWMILLCKIIKRGRIST